MPPAERAGLRERSQPGETLLSFFSPFPHGGRRGTNTKRRVVAATAQSKPASFAPHETWGETEPEQTAAGAKRPTSRRRIAARMNNMDVGRPGRPSPSLPPAIGSGAAGSPKGRAVSEPLESAAGAAGVAMSQLVCVRGTGGSGIRGASQPLPIAGHDSGEPFNADSFRHAQPLPFDISESLAVPRPENTQDFTSVGSKDFAMRQPVANVVTDVDRVCVGRSSWLPPWRWDRLVPGPEGVFVKLVGPAAGCLARRPALLGLGLVEKRGQGTAMKDTVEDSS